MLAPLLKRSKSARIVNMSSGMGALNDNDGGYAAYRISKTALNAVTVILAAELRGSVAVNSVCPGWVKTDMGGPHATRDVADGADTAVGLRSMRRTASPANSSATARLFRGKSVAARGRAQCAPLAASLLLLSRPAIINMTAVGMNRVENAMILLSSPVMISLRPAFMA